MMTPPLLHSCYLSLTFAIPHFMAQHNCEYLKHTETPSRVPSLTKASSGHTLNPFCSHNLFSSHVSQDTSSNSMVSLCPNSWEHLLKESAGDIREDNYPVNWFKLISSMSQRLVQLQSLSLPLSMWHIHPCLNEPPVDHQPS